MASAIAHRLVGSAFSGWKLVRWNESCGSAGKAFGSDEQSLFHSLDGLFSSVPVFLFPWVRGDRPCGDLQPEKPPPWRRTRFRQVGRCVPNRQEIPGKRTPNKIILTQHFKWGWIPAQYQCVWDCGFRRGVKADLMLSRMPQTARLFSGYLRSKEGKTGGVSKRI